MLLYSAMAMTSPKSTGSSTGQLLIVLRAHVHAGPTWSQSQLLHHRLTLLYSLFLHHGIFLL